MTEIVNHLWQSTLFAAIVALAAFALRSNHAKTRYWLWLAASIKFLLPFSLLVSLGSVIDTPGMGPVVPAVTVEQITTSFAPAPVISREVNAPSVNWWPRIACAVWLIGALFLTARWCRRWMSIREALRDASPLPIAAPIPVLSSPSRLEPGIFGLFRPVLLLPDGIAAKLTGPELEAILAHELTHVRRRDNLTGALHMLVEILCWFHPLVWWIGGKLVQERERACDEAVLLEGSQPHVYAQGIINVCKHYVESPLACAPGVSGADLRKRIEQIMTWRHSHRLSLTRKVALASATLCVLSTPLVIGFLRAQTLPPPPAYTYEVVSIRPATPGEQNSRIGPGPQGGMRTQNTSVMQLLTFAYDLREYQFTNVPSWVRDGRYDVTFTPDKAEITPGPGMPRDQMEGMFNRQRQRMQAILRDRFGLVLRAESKEMPVYSLVQLKSGHKLKTVENPAQGPHMRVNRGQISGNGVFMKMLTDSLSSLLGRPVVNDTGLDGPFDLSVQWTPEASPQLPGGPSRPEEPSRSEDGGSVSIFAALQEQLGLKLESSKGNVTVFAIEKIEKPTEN